jgi:hypothetical protein
VEANPRPCRSGSYGAAGPVPGRSATPCSTSADPIARTLRDRREAGRGRHSLVPVEHPRHERGSGLQRRLIQNQRAERAAENRQRRREQRATGPATESNGAARMAAALRARPWCAPVVTPMGNREENVRVIGVFLRVRGPPLPTSARPGWARGPCSPSAPCSMGIARPAGPASLSAPGRLSRQRGLPGPRGARTGGAGRRGPAGGQYPEEVLFPATPANLANFGQG